MMIREACNSMGGLGGGGGKKINTIFIFTIIAPIYLTLECFSGLNDSSLAYNW